ncbi:hypothetical protein C8A05DRAFT_18439, partial [Staphylotrichum tortipilum]
GSLPVEQYLLRNWDDTSRLSPAAQRQQLIRSFIAADPEATPATELPITPSLEQIATILAPWRPQRLRPAAAKHGAVSHPAGEFYFLRTHYAGGGADDARLRAWLDLDECQGVALPRADEWWVVLDDAELFAQPNGAWMHVYDVFPELVAPRAGRLLLGDDTSSTMDHIRDQVGWMLSEDEPVEEEHWAEAVRGALSTFGNELLVVDQRAFETGELGLVFRDAKGNVIRHGRVRADELNEMVVDESRGALPESGFWLDTEVGDKYRVGGEMTRDIVRLAKEGS